jgi:peptidoglycan/xylan/chitin deacetylase (PgdA/CDA1 family)
MNMMRVKNRMVILLGLLLVSSAAGAGDRDPGFDWPGGARAAVNLAYDDALDSQLDNAIHALNRHGFKGSFYLTLASDATRLRLDEWRAAADQGHELGNHTLFHPCSASKPDREWVLPHNDLDNIPLKALLEQIRLASTMLYAIDGRRQRTFAAPCGDLHAAGDYYIDAIRPEFIAVKAGFGGVTSDMDTLDPYLVGVDAPSAVTGEQLIEVVRQAAEIGTMANFTFNGIGGDYFAVSVEAHDQLLNYLADNNDIYWVDTFLNIMRYVKGKKEV